MFGCAVGTSNAHLGANLDVVYCGNLKTPISSFTVEMVFGPSFGTTRKSLLTKEALKHPPKKHLLNRNMTNEGKKG